MRLRGTSAIVTGAASGLGAAAAAELAAAGASVFGLDLPEAVESAPGVDGLTYVATDVTNGGQVQSAVDAAVASGRPLRTVVNCAGIGPSTRIVGRKGPHDLGLFASVLSVNLGGTFNVMTLAAAAIAATEPQDDGQRGVVVNTASIAAFDGQVGQAAYSASKGGVVGMTLPVARDLAAIGVRVNPIAPGLIDTPIYGEGEASEAFKANLEKGVLFPKRLGVPEEIAEVVLAVVTSSYVNAETIRVDGGIRMQPK